MPKLHTTQLRRDTEHRHSQDSKHTIKGKATSSVFLSKRIAKLEMILKTTIQNKDTHTHTHTHTHTPPHTHTHTHT